MKQLFQDARTAEISIVDVPAPKLLTGSVLVRTASSLVSAGTERAASEFAAKNLLQKARTRPDLVRDVLNKMHRDGVLATISSVRSRLDQPSALGYSSAGTVIAVGEGVTDINVGDRVACAGAGNAVHAEFACVPRLLVSRIPSPNVSFDEAAFTTVGAVALHGIRTAEAKLGDVVAVIGLGLLGQLTIQVLKAAGCCVVGMELSPQRADLAMRMGSDAVSTSASEFQNLCRQYSSGNGVDAVLITAQTSSNDPVDLAGAVARNRAIVTAVGDVAMDIPRRTFYEKELDFRISRSYGPGRYDANYEQKGIDYPIGYVRWTETRNMQAFLNLLAARKLDLEPLITHRFPIVQARDAYDLINGKTGEPFLGVLISYPENASASDSLELSPEPPHRAQAGDSQAIRLGVLGTGSFATRTLLPAIKRSGSAEFVACSSASGSHAQQAAAKFGFLACTTNDHEVVSHPAVNTILIASRHHLHAQQVVAALDARKHVFCEKPLCLNESELAAMAAAVSNAPSSLLMVGFNRRFSRFAVQLKKFLDEVREPLAMHYRVNAGFLPPDHWLNDPQQGGGRIIGEVCHFVDFLSLLVGSAPVRVETRSLPNAAQYSNDNVECSLWFPNGSLGTITYVANGDQAFSKERIEIFGGGSVAVLEDFRRLELVRRGRKTVSRTFLGQDKGHQAEWDAFAGAIRSGSPSPISFPEIAATMMATFTLEESRSTGMRLNVRPVPAATANRGEEGDETAINQAS